MKTSLHHNGGTIEVIEVDDEAVSEDECIAFAALQDIGPYEFERLTGYPIGSDDLFVFDQKGVRSRAYSDHELALLDSGSRMEILETTRHQLAFPCTPDQLLDFVNTISWFFDLPDTFALSVKRTALVELVVVPEKMQKEPPGWIAKARKIAEEWMESEKALAAKGELRAWQNDKSKDCPGVIAIAKYVEGELSTRNIFGRLGVLDFETIKREALVGITKRNKTGKK